MNVMSEIDGKGKARSGIGRIYSSYSNRRQGFFNELAYGIWVIPAAARISRIHDKKRPVAKGDITGCCPIIKYVPKGQFGYCGANLLTYPCHTKLRPMLW